MANKHQVEGEFDKAKGEVKEVVGIATDNEQLQAEGTFDKAKGHVKKGFGNLKEAVREATDGN